MKVLGLQGSPRRKGNSQYLLNAVMKEAEKMGALTHTIHVDRQNILPCKEYIVCEKKGYCPIEDDMKTSVYSLIRWADVIVAASPVFFFNVSAQLKALIDRCQTFWARKYRLKLRDPNSKMRRGCMLAVGASRGKKLFDGVHLTAKYFFDAVDAGYNESIMYPGIEKFGDMAAHASVLNDVNACATRLFSPFQNRKKVLFACRENACRSRMAWAFAMDMAADKLEVYCGGSEPAEAINPQMVTAMAEKGIDMAFQTPQSIDDALREGAPDIIVTMGCGEACPMVPGAKHLDWDLPDPAGESMDFMRRIRDTIEKRVSELISTI